WEKKLSSRMAVDSGRMCGTSCRFRSAGTMCSVRSSLVASTLDSSFTGTLACQMYEWRSPLDVICNSADCTALVVPSSTLISAVAMFTSARCSILNVSVPMRLPPMKMPKLPESTTLGAVFSGCGLSLSPAVSVVAHTRAAPSRKPVFMIAFIAPPPARRLPQGCAQPLGPPALQTCPSCPRDVGPSDTRYVVAETAQQTALRLEPADDQPGPARNDAATPREALPAGSYWRQPR